MLLNIPQYSVQPPLPSRTHNNFSRPKYQSSEVARPWAQGRDGGKLHPGARLSPAEAAILGVHSETALGPHPAPGTPLELHSGTPVCAQTLHTRVYPAPPALQLPCAVLPPGALLCLIPRPLSL